MKSWTCLFLGVLENRDQDCLKGGMDFHDSMMSTNVRGSHTTLTGPKALSSTYTQQALSRPAKMNMDSCIIPSPE